MPRIRFLLADDPGAGKTIMAGLLIKELKIRGLIKRTLIVTPASLSFQWQREMKDSFARISRSSAAMCFARTTVLIRGKKRIRSLLLCLGYLASMMQTKACCVA